MALVRIHAALVLAAVLCTAGFSFELWRALSGNELSWVYVFEWPILLVVAVRFWKLMANDARGVPRRRGQTDDPHRDEAALAEWNRYVDELDDKAEAGP